jgi:hypothetical protein
MRATLFGVLAASSLAASAFAQSTAFTYQGRLKNGASPAAGLHDFRFRLWDAAAGGAQLGSTQCVDNILVTEGLFTSTIDFGQQFASPTQRFLEIEVRADTGLNCTSANGFIVLGPRQPLTAAPLASHAKTAFSLAAADGSPLDAVIVSNDGNVGIGTATPAVPLQIARDLDAVLVLQDTGPAATQAGYLSFWNNAPAETAWVGFGTPGSPHFSMANGRVGGDIELFSGTGGRVRLATSVTALTVNSAGSVGIGTETPLSKLDVRGDIRLGSAGQYRAAAGEENLRIVRGTVGELGNVLRGAGFTVDHSTTATYIIHFNVAFAGVPSVTATAGRDGVQLPSIVAMTDGTSTTAVTIIVRSSDEYWVDRSFSFIAVGPR